MRLLGNIAILFVLQLGIYILPLVVTPYLSRVLGVESFGALGVAAALIGYSVIVVEWGFSLSGTRDVAQNHENAAELSRIFWRVMTAKVILGIVSLIVLNGVLPLIPAFQHIAKIVILYEIQIVGAVLNADWFLRGLERMGWFATVSLGGRLVTIPLIFIFVRSPDDAAIAALIQGAAFLISAVASIAVIARLAPVGAVQFDLKAAFRCIRDAGSLFFSTAGISMYTQSNLLIVGLACGTFEAGLFSGADRIRRGVQGLSGPISGAVFPRVNKLLAAKSQKVRRLLFWFLAAQFSGTLVLSLVMYWFAPLVVNVFLGAQFDQAIPVVRAFAPIPALVGISNVLGTNIMVPLGMNREFMLVTLVAGVFNLCALTMLAWFYGAAGGALAVSATEALVTLGTAYFVVRNLHRLPAGTR